MAGVTGIGSGIDIDSIVKGMVTAERAPKEAQLANLEKKTTTQITAVGVLKSAINDFQTALGGLNKPELFQARSATSSKTDQVTVTASTKAGAGSYQVEVKSLATSSKVALQPFSYTAEAPATFGGGTLTFKVGEKSLSINVDEANNTLTGIRDAINEGGKDIGLAATIVTDDAGARLVLSSATTGAGEDITVEGKTTNAESGVFSLEALRFDGSTVEPKMSDYENDPTGYADAMAVYRSGPMRLSQAQSAQVSVDGLLITSKTNKIEGAIEGVTLDLKAKTAENEPLTIDIAEDKEGVKTQIQSFVDSYNKLIGIISAQTKVTSAGEGNNPVTGALVGDATARALLNTIRNELVNLQGDGAVRALTDIGITTQKDGTLAIDSGRLDKAMADNFSELPGLFTGDKGIASRLDEKLKPYTQTGGILEQRNKAMEETRSDIKDQRESLDRRITSLQERLYKQFNAMDLLVGQLSNTSNSLIASLENLPWASGNSK